MYPLVSIQFCLVHYAVSIFSSCINHAVQYSSFSRSLFQVLCLSCFVALRCRRLWCLSGNAVIIKARFPFKRNPLRCVRCVNENRKKRKRLRWQAASHGCHCFDRAFLLAGACVCCVKNFLEVLAVSADLTPDDKLFQDESAIWILPLHLAQSPAFSVVILSFFMMDAVSLSIRLFLISSVFLYCGFHMLLLFSFLHSFITNFIHTWCSYCPLSVVPITIVYIVHVVWLIGYPLFCPWHAMTTSWQCSHFTLWP